MSVSKTTHTYDGKQEYRIKSNRRGWLGSLFLTNLACKILKSNHTAYHRRHCNLRWVTNTIKLFHSTAEWQKQKPFLSAAGLILGVQPDEHGWVP